MEQSKDNIRNFVIISHIDHGKSTLADRLLELTKTVDKRLMKDQMLDQMDLEREKGITIKLQPVRMQFEYPVESIQSRANGKSHTLDAQPNTQYSNSAEGFQLNLIDTPGHVDFSYEVSRSLQACEGALLVIDASQGIQAQTLANVYLAIEQDLKIIPVLNKIDLPAADIEKVSNEVINLLGCTKTDILEISAKTGEGVENVLEAIVKQIPPPKGDPTKPPRALIFDSLYDEYRGVILYVRLIDGHIEKDQKIHMMATKSSGIALDVGALSPKMNPTGKLNTGEIGYIVTNLKSVGEARVGDTVTTINQKNKANKNTTPSLEANARKERSAQQGVQNVQRVSTGVPDNAEDRESSQSGELGSSAGLDDDGVVQALPGYKEVKPFVYAGVFPASSDDYSSLKDALEKLTLNDSALRYEPESSSVLGHGFRVGFLGLLHLEIVKERLERAENIELVITNPSTTYKVSLNDGQELIIKNASDLPDQSKISEIYEPWVKGEIVVPKEFMGGVLGLIIEARGQQKNISYLDDEIALIQFVAPLSSMLTNFYDQLKSISKGYGSLNYDLDDYKSEDLVRLDFLIASERVDSLSLMTHRSEAQVKGREIAKKLKEIIPRQLFEVSIQATIGGKIVAREDVKALGKNVTGHLYGGDVSRKKKLWAKQKKGKARMKKFGKVDIPNEIFTVMLKKD